jgi:hypothetical protein
MIQVCNSGGECATLLGTASQQAEILENLNLIWAQSGIRIELLPDVMSWTNNTAYSNGTALRQVTDSGPTNSDDSVMNVYFVAKSPCHSALGANSSAGCAWIDGNGVAIYVGSGLLGWGGGREVVSSVLGHEIGHNLGLNHTASYSTNLMSPGGTTDQLTGTQTGIVFSNSGGIDGYDLLTPYEPMSFFDTWKAANEIQGGSAEDDDFDGITNLTEFVLGLTGRPDADQFPKPVLSPGSLEMVWTVSVNPDAIEDGFKVLYEASYDLQDWFVLDATQAAPDISFATVGTETVITTSSQRVYFRIRVEDPVL